MIRSYPNSCVPHGGIQADYMNVSRKVMDFIKGQGKVSIKGHDVVRSGQVGGRNSRQRALFQGVFKLHKLWEGTNLGSSQSLILGQ
jgi:hypothetical protein